MTSRIVRHKKRGSLYVVLGLAEGQISNPDAVFDDNGEKGRAVYEGDEIVIYVAENGKMWWRFPDEFEDGRFEDAEQDAPFSAHPDDKNILTALDLLARHGKLMAEMHGKAVTDVQKATCQFAAAVAQVAAHAAARIRELETKNG